MVKYYKEDLLNVLRENSSVDQLQEVMHIDLTNKDILMDILRLGLKKEDLNVILSNSHNITEEALENYRKPNQRRSSVIIFREVPLGRKLSEEPNQVENSIENQNNDVPSEIPNEEILRTRVDSKVILKSRADFKKILLTREEFKLILKSREEFKHNNCSAEGIIAAREEFTEDFCEIVGILASQDDSEEILLTREDFKLILKSREDFKIILKSREEFKDNSFSAEGIIAEREEFTEDFCEIVGILASQDDSEEILLTREDFKLILKSREDFKIILKSREEFKDNSFSAEGIIAEREDSKNIISVQEDFKDNLLNVEPILASPVDLDLILKSREEFKDNSFNAEGIIAAVDNFTDRTDLQTEIVENDSVNENLKETFLLSLNKIKNIRQTKEKFQERLKGLVRKNVAYFEKQKSSYRQSDKNYQFFKNHIVPMAKYHNIPLESYLARDQVEPLRFDRKSRLLRQQNVN